MVRRLFSVLLALAGFAGFAACTVSGEDGSRSGDGGPNGNAAGSGYTVGGNGVIGTGGATPVGGASVTTGGSNATAGGISTGGATATAGSAGAGGGPGPLCGGPAIPANKGRCSTGIVVAKGSALMIHDFEDPGPDNDYLGVFFGDGRSGKWFDSHDLTNKPTITMTAAARLIDLIVPGIHPSLDERRRFSEPQETAV